MPPTNKDKTLLVLSQVYKPDPAAVGQYMAAAAAEMANRGYRVVSLVARRGYHDPTQKFPKRETLEGVQVRRIGFSSFGTKSMAKRLLGGLSFVLQAMFLGLFTRRLKGILVSTSPPMCSMAAIVIARIRRVPIVYWAMDLNPDQLVALGKVQPTAFSVKVFEWLNRAILRKATRVVTLDRFMAERLYRKVDVRDKIAIMPPWPHEEHVEPVEHDDNPFRREHHLDDKFVIMYSGNMALTSPVDTVLQTALRMQDLSNVVFMFIGGGFGMEDVTRVLDEHQPANIIALPYQPMEMLRYSLSAADVHVATLNDVAVGIVHPCKVYGSMAVCRPTLFFGPRPSHFTDILDDAPIGWQVALNDVQGAEKLLRQIVRMDQASLREMGEKARSIITSRFSMQHLKGAFCDVVQGIMDDDKDAAQARR